jgi:hypothetical protein
MGGMTTMTNTPDAALHKAARLVVLLHLDDQGKLAGKSVRQVQAEYFPGTHFTTISRDLKALPRLREMMAEISPL